MSHVHFEQKYFLKANKQQSHTKFLINKKSIINWKSAFFRRSYKSLQVTNKASEASSSHT